MAELGEDEYLGEKKYRTALYLRLSREERDGEGRKKTESDSIASQRELLFSYVKGRKDLEICGIYTDDGYSGADFQRPDFCRMMKDVEKGCIDCVLVKDLSRLGRDYIEAGRLVQKTFPALSVRFIAAADGYDSLTADFHQQTLFLPIKNFMNDSYCRDISRKVRSGQKVKRDQGKFLGAFAPYGYQKGEEKNTLVPDQYAGMAVKGMFRWKLEGMSLLSIARRLEDYGILAPAEYKKLHGQRFTGGFAGGIWGRWSPSSVKRILTNEIYQGIMVQGKTMRVNYKVKKSIARAREDWVRVEGVHKALVCPQDFARVQKLLETPGRKLAGREKSHRFLGLLFCKDCQKAMVRRVNRYRGEEKIFFICQTRNKGEGCTRHCILEEDLERVVFVVVQKYLQLYFAEEDWKAWAEKTRADFRQSEVVEREISFMRRLAEELRQRKKPEEGLFGEEELVRMESLLEERLKALDKAISRQEDLVKELRRQAGEAKRRLRLPKKELDREALLAFVEKIQVWEGKGLELTLRWREGL